MQEQVEPSWLLQICLNYVGCSGLESMSRGGKDLVHCEFVDRL